MKAPNYIALFRDMDHHDPVTPEFRALMDREDALECVDDFYVQREVWAQVTVWHITDKGMVNVTDHILKTLADRHEARMISPDDHFPPRLFDHASEWVRGLFEADSRNDMAAHAMWEAAE